MIMVTMCRDAEYEKGEPEERDRLHFEFGCCRASNKGARLLTWCQMNECGALTGEPVSCKRV